MKDQQKHKEKLFGFIVNFKKEHDGNSPSFRTISTELGISLSYIRDLLNILISEHRIKYGTTRTKEIEIVGGRWTMKGQD
jgi:hypothetical protein